MLRLHFHRVAHAGALGVVISPMVESMREAITESIQSRWR